MKHLPERVIIGECWARDGLQGWDQFIPTEKKITLLNRMQEVGFKRIEVSPPLLIPN
jgi:hydroxymethylglutaryl-CoA lyase